MTDEAWIEQSLARLESLEAQKAQYEAAGQPVPAELDEEIGALYVALESAAAEDEAPAAPAPAPAPAAAPMSDPFAAPPAAAMHQAPAAAAPVMSAPMDDYDDDFKPKGKGGLIAVVAVVLLAAGGGGYWYMTQQKKPAPKPEPSGPAKVISASSVPEDTQEPQAAKGGNADKTPEVEIPEGETRRRPSGNGGGGKRRPRNNNNKKKDDGRKVKVDSDSRDPLAGI